MARMRKKKSNGSNHHPPSYENPNPSGFIFTCDQYTKPQCFQLQVFGLPISKLHSVSMIERGTTLFLFDCQLKILYGVYTATSNGGPNLVAHAFSGKYPAQVKFQVFKDCHPISERIFGQAIRENYFKGKFRPELNSYQVNRLMSLFQERIVPRQPPPLIDSRNAHQTVAPPTHYPWPPSSVDTQHHPLAAPPPPPQQQGNQFYAAPTEIPSSSTLAFPTNVQYYAPPPSKLSSVNTQHHPLAAPPPPPPLPQEQGNQFYAAPTKDPSSLTLAFPTNVQYYAPPPSYPDPPPSYPAPPPNYQHYPAPPNHQAQPPTLLPQTSLPSHQFYHAPQTDPSYYI